MKRIRLIILTCLAWPFLILNGQSDPLSTYFPDFDVLESNSPFEGYFFLAAQGVNAPEGKHYIAIVDNYGVPVFFKIMPKASVGMKLLNDGTIGYAHGTPRKLYLMDTMLNVFDTITTVGEKLDAHDWAINHNGDYHRLLFAQYRRIVDMSQLIDGGQTAATIEETIIQEFDENNNLLFNWKTENLFNILDGNDESFFVDFTREVIDYSHLNGIDFYSDTSFVVSSRHMDEITCIDRRTGEIIWRLGGKNNQFTFLNDTLGFNHQHCPRRLANGNLLLFDNGNLHVPEFSSALEYELNVVNMTAKLVNRYRRSTDVFGKQHGSVQRLENGNTLATWGPGWPSFTEFHPDGTIAMEIDMTEHSYCPRVYKYAWATSVFDASMDSVNFGMYDGTNPLEQKIQLVNNCDTAISITSAVTRSGHFSVNTVFPLLLEPGIPTDINLLYQPQDAETGYQHDMLTLCVDNQVQRIARQVFLEGNQQDDVAPLVSILPDSSNVPVDAMITIEFSEPVRESDLSNIDHHELEDLVQLSKLDENGPNVPFKAIINTEKTKITITPVNSLIKGTTYYIGLSDPLEDYSGNAVIQTSQTFQTIRGVAVEQHHTDYSLKVYPNPSYGSFTIQMDYLDEVALEVYSIAGKLLFIKDNVTKGSQINLGNQSPGIYFLQLSTRSEGIIGRRKLVIQ
ncbi:arylsulfotransferase family protein [Bacteroidota bacterium]